MINRSVQLIMLLIIFVVVANNFIEPLNNMQVCLAKQKCFGLEVVDQQNAREQGLSGREGLAKNRAMLFVFDKPGFYCFWMKDMKFNIDIVWLDQSKKIVKIVDDATPSSYPESFCPNDQVVYVLEFNSGVAKDFDLYYGQQLNY